MKRLVLSLMLLIPAALNAQLEPDAEGCKDSKLLTRMPMCRIYECSGKDFDAAELQVGRKGDDKELKSLEGKTELIHYECDAKISALQIVRNAEAALRKAGYKTIFSGKGDDNLQMTTVQNGAQWIEVRPIQINDIFHYWQTSVLVQAMQQDIAATADAFATEIEKNGRVSVYGINFDTGKATVRPDSEGVLQEIASLLKAHDDWKIKVEGHTDNVGAKAMNQTLSQQRAAAVVAWLVAQEIDKARLTAQGLGDTKPVADNTGEEGRAKNRRVELVKM